ncbi:MAG TPA: FAD-dependent monooxygenase [Solirubrobacteraceae bacterium]|jgi:2-polyprenyl-6-methoxyphenol hydroxylase-like FAD-dependent oxidoreductase|nr:FAD-dependent monooxygenase [Solirubrobacteraceae bacterium]
MTKVVVVGAGIGGLATSIALRETDVEVLVLERAAELSKVELGAGVTLWANAMLILDRLGVGAEIRERGAVLKCFEQRNTRGRLLSRWPLDEMARRLGAPICGINRPDLHAALVRGAGGQQVRTGCNVERFEQGEGAVSVALSTGASESGDVLIGADGIDSTIRRQLLGAQAPRHSGLTMWRANVPYDESIAPPVDFIAWWGSGTKFVIFRSGPERLSWEAIVTSPPGGQDAPGARKRAVLDRFADFTAPVHRIVEATDEQAIFRTDVFDRPPDERWGEGRVTLLGDAAHPMTFAVGQGAAQALEDALAIGRALGKGGELDRGGSIEAALRAYEQPRIARAARFQTMAWRLARAGALESRPAQALRNTAFTLSSPIGWRMQVKDMALPT